MARGLPSIRRVNAKNFIQVEADHRLKEVIAPYQRQGLNALGVDAYDVLLFIKKPSTLACTCREVQMTSDIGDAKFVPPKSGISETHEISIDWRRPLFGEPHEARDESGDDGTELSDYDFEDDDEPVRSNQLIESNADCGICYRSGFVPGLVQYGKHRVVLTTHDVVGNNGCTIDRTAAPHTFDRLTATGYVEFGVQVPKYFNSVRYSVRNNIDMVDAELSTEDGLLSTAWLKSHAGQQVRIRVSTETFTHLVLTFDLGVDTVRANIAQLNKQSDWTLFNTIGNLNVILPMTIPELTTGSVIVVPKVGLALIITDITYLRPEDGRNLDWSVNTRVCQPQEPALKIHKDLPLA